MDEGAYIAYIIGEAIRRIFYKLTWFSCFWFLFYGILGGWLKQKIVGMKLSKDLEKKTRLGPVLVFNMLFSIVLVNPYILFGLGFLGIEVDNKFDRSVSNVLNAKLYEIADSYSKISTFIVICILFFAILPFLLECILLRWASQWKYLRWFRWDPPLKRAMLANLIVSILGFGIGYVGFYIADYWYK